MVYKQNRCKNCNSVYTYFDFGAGCLEQMYCPNCITAIENALKTVKKRYEGRWQETTVVSISQFDDIIKNMPGEYSMCPYFTDDDTITEVYDIIYNYAEYRVIYHGEYHEIYVKMQYDLERNVFTQSKWLNSKQYDILRRRVLVNKNSNYTVDLYDVGEDTE